MDNCLFFCNKCFTLTEAQNHRCLGEKYTSQEHGSGLDTGGELREHKDTPITSGNVDLIAAAKSTPNSDCSCQYCDKIFTSLYWLNSHLFYVQRYECYACSECKVGFYHQTDLNTHFDSHLKDTCLDTYSEEQHQCPICSVICDNKSSLNVHMKIHHGKNFECPCGGGFIHLFDLERHLVKCYVGPGVCIYCGQVPLAHALKSMLEKDMFVSLFSWLLHRLMFKQ